MPIQKPIEYRGFEIIRGGIGFRDLMFIPNKKDGKIIHRDGSEHELGIVNGDWSGYFSGETAARAAIDTYINRVGI